MYKMHVFLIVLLIMASSALFAQKGGNGSPSVQGQEQPAPQVAVDGNSAVQTAQPQNNTITIDRQTYETALRANETALKTSENTIGFLKWLLGLLVASGLVGGYFINKNYKSYKEELENSRNDLIKAKDEIRENQQTLIATTQEYKKLCDTVKSEKESLTKTLEEYRDVKRKIKSEVAIGTDAINNKIDLVNNIHLKFEEKNEQALKELRVLINNIANEYFKNGYEHYEKGDYDKAIENFDRVITNDQHNIDAYKLNSICYVMKDKTNEAINQLQNGVKNNPDSQELLKTIVEVTIDYCCNDDGVDELDLLNNVIPYAEKLIEITESKEGCFELATIKAILGHELTEILELLKQWNTPLIDKKTFIKEKLEPSEYFEKYKNETLYSAFMDRIDKKLKTLNTDKFFVKALYYNKTFDFNDFYCKKMFDNNKLFNNIIYDTYSNRSFINNISKDCKFTYYKSIDDFVKFLTETEMFLKYIQNLDKKTILNPADTEPNEDDLDEPDSSDNN